MNPTLDHKRPMYRRYRRRASRAQALSGSSARTRSRFDRRLEFGEVAAVEVSEVVQHWDALRGQLQHAQQQALLRTKIMFQHQLLRLIELADLLHREIIRVLEWEIAHNQLW